MIEIDCPGCGLRMPRRESLTAHGYYNAAPECWSVYTEVLGTEYSNAVLFGQVHQLTVDTYAAQHAGGGHPDKSVDIHLTGLHLVLEEGVKPTSVPPLLQQLAQTIETWPHFEPPRHRWEINVADVALASESIAHAAMVRRWSESVWAAWSHVHAAIAELRAIVPARIQ